MELKEGMLVRTKDGTIDKIAKDENGACSCPTSNCVYCEHHILATFIITKASYNIIDLIEVGDYVNGSEVVDFENKYIEENDKFIPFGVVTENCYLEDTDSWIIEKDIKSIVTKEQFESMSYKLGD